MRRLPEVMAVCRRGCLKLHAASVPRDMSLHLVLAKLYNLTNSRSRIESYTEGCTSAAIAINDSRIILIYFFLMGRILPRPVLESFLGSCNEKPCQSPDICVAHILKCTTFQHRRS